MKSLKLTLLALIAVFAFSFGNQATAKTATAESVFEFANTLDHFDEEALRIEINSLSKSEKSKLLKMAIKEAKRAEKAGVTSAPPALYILAIFFPPLAVGIHTGWEMPTVWNFLWTLCG
ncbi:MAG: YqaE/Pmp3 family membrane protein, partial [Bacteroidetes bacterium]|nr:YqaE/Pmp3 family membrane protein [Bacteroidota bacterium]